MRNKRFSHKVIIKSIFLQDSDNPDLRDRGYIYWRLLSTDPVAAKEVVLAEKPLISEETDLIEPTLLEELICHIGTLASVYHKPPSAFVEGSRGVQHKRLPCSAGSWVMLHIVLENRKETLYSSQTSILTLNFSLPVFRAASSSADNFPFFFCIPHLLVARVWTARKQVPQLEFRMHHLLSSHPREISWEIFSI